MLSLLHVQQISKEETNGQHGKMCTLWQKSKIN